MPYFMGRTETMVFWLRRIPEMMPEVINAAVVSTDGLLMAEMMVGGFDEEGVDCCRYAAALSAGQHLIDTGGMGKTHEMQIFTNNCCHILIPINNEAFVVMLHHPLTNSEPLRHRIADILSEIDRCV
jgi:predicted regulator of Ras-like GTPase activity (Roadblock/LC7/MglB family)